MNITPSPHIGNEFSLSIGVGRHGRNATLENAVSDCGAFLLKEDRAIAIAVEMAGIVANWKNIFREDGVSEADIEAVSSAILSPGVDYGSRNDLPKLSQPPMFELNQDALDAIRNRVGLGI